MTFLPYWLDFALRPTLALAWMVIGLGVPWALVLLPRRDWRSLPLVALTAFAAGPALLTAWMFVLGTLGGANQTAALTPANILLGTLAIAILGAACAAYKWRVSPAPLPAQRQPLALDERMLVTLIIAACVLRWLAAVWYPFWEYDPIWVYGYEGKLYTLLGYIPQHIGYYPQFLPLQYAYAQIMTGGVNDHAARAIFPLYHWGSILAAYALGRLTISRRVGIYTAALWAMYPHVAQWATVGDLEIPLTFATTGAAAFFLKAWQERGEGKGERGEKSRDEGKGERGKFRGGAGLFSRLIRRKPSQLDTLPSALGLLRNRGNGTSLPFPLSPFPYSLISGLFLAVALWTKPTGGALILGVMLLVAADALRARFVWNKWLPSLRVALWCAAATVPLGGLWYARNVLLGHRAIDFPHPFWLTQAMRSGVEFGWPLLAAGLLCAWLLWGSGLRIRPKLRQLIIGWIFIAAGVLPGVISPHRMGLIEWGLFFTGAAVLFTTLWPLYSQHATAQAKSEVSIVGWGLLLALPYFVVWFISYSYHYRLSFAIVPLMILPVAVILARWIPPQLADGSRRGLRPLVGIPLLLACIPALIAPLYHYEGGWDYLWSNEYPNDWRRLDSTNYALSMTVQRLQRDIARRGFENPVIFAPGLQRLPFFFPLDDVRITETPTDLDQLRGVTYYVFTQEARWLYAENDQPEINPVTGSMYRPELLTNRGGAADASFFSEIYLVHNIDRRYLLPRNLDVPPQAVTWPFAALAGTKLLGGTVLGGETPPTLALSFLASGPAALEYTLYIHLIAPDGSLVTTWDSLPADGPFAWYSTRLWQPDEVVNHREALPLPEGVTLEPGAVYTLKIGWYDVFNDNQRLPAVLADGSTVDGIELPYTLTAPSD